MKQVVTIIMGAFALLMSGCQTDSILTDRTADERWAARAEAVAVPAVYEVLRNNPDMQPSFEVALRELRALYDQPEIDYWAVYEIIERFPVEQLTGPRASIYVTSGNLLYQEFGSPSLDIERIPGLRGFVKGLVVGVERGMQMASDERANQDVNDES